MHECKDNKCPVHGSISVRGAVLTGVVVSARPGKTVVVERELVRFVPKYERYKKEKSRVYAHNPACINAKENDVVRIGETRKLSKIKNFVVLEVLGKKKLIKGEEGFVGIAPALKEKETVAKGKPGKQAGKKREEEEQPAEEKEMRGQLLEDKDEEEEESVEGTAGKKGEEKDIKEEGGDSEEDSGEEGAAGKEAQEDEEEEKE